MPRMAAACGTLRTSGNCEVRFPRGLIRLVGLVRVVCRVRLIVAVLVRLRRILRVHVVHAAVGVGTSMVWRVPRRSRCTDVGRSLWVERSESSRNRAPTDSQHFSQDYSQQCSQTSSRHAVEGSPCSGNSQQHSQQHSQDYSQQHSQALVTALRMEGSIESSRLMIGVSGGRGSGNPAEFFLL